MEETGEPRENHRPVIRYWQTNKQTKRHQKKGRGWRGKINFWQGWKIFNTKIWDYKLQMTKTTTQNWWSLRSLCPPLDWHNNMVIQINPRNTSNFLNQYWKAGKMTRIRNKTDITYLYILLYIDRSPLVKHILYKLGVIFLSQTTREPPP